jgi:hypothetical protein
VTHSTPDFDRFHRELAASGHGELAGAAARGLAPITFALDDGRAWSFAPAAGGVDVVAGTAETGAVVRLSERAWSRFVTEHWTRYGLLYTGNVDFTRGEFSDLCRWEPALRALFHGRPVYDPDTLSLVDRAGRPLDLDRSFDLADEPAEMAHFLQTTGYLHVREVFAASEIDELRDEVERRAAQVTAEDTELSFWTRGPDGEPIIANLKYGAVGSPMLTELHDDPRVRRILDLAAEPHLRPNIDRNEGTKIVFKRPGATEGLVDLPLHTDCGMGLHPVACQMVLIGVHLDAGTPASGQLHVAAGSHTSTTPDPAFNDTSRWPIVALLTAAGDCTVHFSHSLHAAPAPVGDLPPGQHARRTAYLCFAPPALFDVLEPFEDLVHGEGLVDARPEEVLVRER